MQDVPFCGAALTARPLLGDLWRRCCTAAEIPFLTGTSDANALLASERSSGKGLLVLIDPQLGTARALTTLRSMAATVLLVAETTMSPGLRDVLGRGMDGMVTIADRLPTLQEALSHLVAGRSYASPAAVRLLLDEHRDRRLGNAPARDVRLSDRERAVLQAMVDGWTTKETARRLGIAVKTVEAHRTRIFTRLNVRTQGAAIHHALLDPGLLRDG